MRATSPILALAVCAFLGAAVSAADAAVQVTQGALPAAVLTALQTNAGTKEFTTITQSTDADGKVTYAAIFVKDGAKNVVTVTADGTLVSTAAAK